LAANTGQFLHRSNVVAVLEQMCDERRMEMSPTIERLVEVGVSN
jgi:hypothetical protein